MKKKDYNNEELDLVDLFIIIWNEKLKIFIISILVILIGFSLETYNYKKKSDVNNQELFEFSLKINPANNLEFFQFISFINAMSMDSDNKKTLLIKLTNNFNKEEIFERFSRELMDYEEIVNVLDGNTDFSKNIKNLSEREKQIELYKYANLLTIEINELPQDKFSHYINFKWHNKDQGTKILIDTINLTLNKLEETIFKELDEYFKLNKKLVAGKDLQRIDFLVSQREIAKELNIQKNQIDSYNFYQFNSNEDITLTPYYLVGYEAIDKEIETLKKRNYEQFNLIEKMYEKIKNSNDNEWVKYNLLMLSTKNLSVKQSEKKPINIALIVFALLIAIIYVLVSNRIKSKRLHLRK